MRVVEHSQISGVGRIRCSDLMGLYLQFCLAEAAFLDEFGIYDGSARVSKVQVARNQRDTYVQVFCQAP